MTFWHRRVQRRSEKWQIYDTSPNQGLRAAGVSLVANCSRRINVSMLSRRVSWESVRTVAKFNQRYSGPINFFFFETSHDFEKQAFHLAVSLIPIKLSERAFLPVGTVPFSTSARLICAHLHISLEEFHASFKCVPPTDVLNSSPDWFRNEKATWMSKETASRKLAVFVLALHHDVEDWEASQTHF